MREKKARPRTHTHTHTHTNAHMLVSKKEKKKARSPNFKPIRHLLTLMERERKRVHHGREAELSVVLAAVVDECGWGDNIQKKERKKERKRGFKSRFLIFPILIKSKLTRACAKRAWMRRSWARESSAEMRRRAARRRRTRPLWVAGVVSKKK